MSRYFDAGMDPSEISVRISEMLVATVESSDEMIDSAVSQVLRMLRNQLKMDVVFVSEFIDGQRVFKRVDAGDGVQAVRVGDSDPVEATYCQRVLDGRLPRIVRDVKALPADTDLPDLEYQVGSYISTPITLENGQLYGVLCAYCSKPHPELTAKDLKNLQLAAQLASRSIKSA
jgi:GAF domain-containing protein